MSDETNSENNSENFCIECKNELSKQGHKKDCSFNKTKKLIEPTTQRDNLADYEATKAQLKSEHEKRDQETAKKLSEQKAAFEKEQKVKQKLIEQILVRDPKANLISLNKMSADDLKTFYKGLTETIDTENRKINKIKVTCPNCRKYLGITTSLKEIQSMQKDHRQECEKTPKGTSNTIKLLLGLALISLAVGVIFLKQNPHILKKKKPCSDCDKESEK